MYNKVKRQRITSNFIDFINSYKTRLMPFMQSNTFVSLLVGFFFILFFSPYLLYGKDSYILIHDNFDQGWTSLKILLESGELFGNSQSTVLPMLNGIPRGYFNSELSYIFILVNFMDTFWASVLNRFIQAFIGFLGMQLLLKNHFNYHYKNQDILIAGVSLCFAFLPFWPLGLLSVAGQPLLLNSFLNLRKKKNSFYDWIVITVFPFCSSLVLTGLFIGILLFFIFLYDLKLHKKFNHEFIAGLILLSVIYVLVEYRLFYITFFNDAYVSHRSNFNIDSISFIEAIKNAKKMLFYGHYSAHSLHSRYIDLTILLSALIIFEKKIIDKTLILAFSLVVIFSAISGFYNWSLFDTVKNNFMILNAFRWDRFWWLNPILWYLCFYIALSYITNFFKRSHLFIYIIIGLQLSYLFRFHQYGHHYGKTLITYNQFFAANQMKKINDYIGRPQNGYRVGSIGIYPCVSQNAGFYTIDGYMSTYPMRYKLKFREIIKNELIKNKSNLYKFDNWGNRCYLFIDDIDKKKVMRNNNQQINNLNLNFKKLKSMNCEYLFSSVKIKNLPDKKLKFEKVFKDNDSYWDIFLYKVL